MDSENVNKTENVDVSTMDSGNMSPSSNGKATEKYTPPHSRSDSVQGESASATRSLEDMHWQSNYMTVSLKSIIAFVCLATAALRDELDQFSDLQVSILIKGDKKFESLGCPFDAATETSAGEDTIPPEDQEAMQVNSIV